MAAQINETNFIFDNLSKKLSSLAYVKSKNDKLLLSKLLSDFNSLNYGESWKVINEKAVLVINQCCFLVAPDDTSMVKSALQLFYSLLTKQNVCVEGKTLSVATAWVVSSLKAKAMDQMSAGLLVLQALVRGKAHKITDTAEVIVELCRQLMVENVKEEPPQIYLNSLNCIESLVFCEEESDITPDTTIVKCCQIFINLFYETPALKNPIWQCKCFISGLRGLGNLAGKNAPVLNSVLPEVFGVIKGYMLYGVPGQDHYQVEKIIPSNVALPEQLKSAQPAKKSMGKYDRKSKKKVLTPISNVAKDEDEGGVSRDRNNGYVATCGNNGYVATCGNNGYVATCEHTRLSLDVTSDSDFSDGEAGAAGQARRLQAKVRRCSLLLLGNLLVHGDPKTMTRYLPCLLPGDVTTPHSRHLSTALLQDPSPACRSEVLLVLSIVLTKFKRFFSLADSLSRSSFTTLSNSVASIIAQLHAGLTTALTTENYKIVTTHILKTISDLIRCTPYHKLEPGLLTSLTREVVPVLKKKDVNAQIAALVVFGCVASTDPKIDEVRNIVFENFQNGKNLAGKPWLFEECVGLLHVEGGCNPAVAVECLQVLAALVRNFPIDTVVRFPSDVIEALGMTSPRHEFLMRLYAAKLTEATVAALQATVRNDDEDGERASVCLAASVWEKILFGAISDLMQSDDPALRAAACDCVANVAITTDSPNQASLIFDQLPRRGQILCITMVFGCARDAAAPVRCAAARALAVLVQLASLRRDSLFLLDAVDAFFAAAVDESSLVRVQAAWLFGHIAEAALANQQEGLDEELEEDMLIRLLEAGIKLTHDAKKGKPYAVRGMAQILSLVAAERAPSHRDVIARAVDALIQTAATGSFMKARWNACYALATALATPVVGSEAKAQAFPVLFNLVQHYKNFKVRISAGHALAALPDRSAYGDLYLPTWRALLSALDNAENIADFSEYQHRDHLVDQICSSLCRLVSLVTPADLLPLQQLLLHHTQPLRHQLTRYQSRVVPEKGGVILSGDSHLSHMVARGDLSSEERSALSVLCAAFLSDQTI